VTPRDGTSWPGTPGAGGDEELDAVEDAVQAEVEALVV
jgi:hypothetical protein